VTKKNKQNKLFVRMKRLRSLKKQTRVKLKTINHRDGIEFKVKEKYKKSPDIILPLMRQLRNTIT
jgi:hypothetical protein